MTTRTLLKTALYLLMTAVLLFILINGVLMRLT